MTGPDRFENVLLRLLVSLIPPVPPDLTGAPAREFVFYAMGHWIACGTHSLWAVAFWANGGTMMAIYNLVVAALFGFCGLVWRRRRGPRWLVRALYFFEIPFHALMASVVTGAGTMFWVMALVPTVPIMISPRMSWGAKGACAGVLTLIALSIGVLSRQIDPLAPLSPGWETFLFVTSCSSVSSALILFLGINQYFVDVAEAAQAREFDRAEGLLRNILPDPIALRLKDGERVIANEHREVTVVFADIVDFTASSAKLTPGALVETLNVVFSEFDVLADRHKAEKIKTIGDAYMVVVGVPDETSNHAEIAVALAKDMQAKVRDLRARLNFDVKLRIGVNSGPVVAGVIGHRKFAYDLWGDAVNVAARMESQGQAGQILTTEATAKLLPASVALVPEGLRDIKGKGQMPVFSVRLD